KKFSGCGWRCKEAPLLLQSRRSGERLGGPAAFEEEGEGPLDVATTPRRWSAASGRGLARIGEGDVEATGGESLGRDGLVDLAVEDVREGDEALSAADAGGARLARIASHGRIGARELTRIAGAVGGDRDFFDCVQGHVLGLAALLE